MKKSLVLRWTHSVLNSELLEAPETGLKLCITGTRGSSRYFNVGLVKRARVCVDFPIAYRILYMLLNQMFLVSWSRVILFCRGSHGREKTATTTCCTRLHGRGSAAATYRTSERD